MIKGMLCWVPCEHPKPPAAYRHSLVFTIAAATSTNNMIPAATTVFTMLCWVRGGQIWGALQAACT